MPRLLITGMIVFTLGHIGLVVGLVPWPVTVMGATMFTIAGLKGMGR